MAKPPEPLAVTVMVPLPPVCSFSGLPEVPVACETLVPLTDRFPEVDITLCDKLTAC